MQELLTMNSKQLATLDRDKTVFFFSVATLEDMGPHLPLGLPLMRAQTQARMTAEKLESELTGWSAVLMPPAPMGIDHLSPGVHLTVRPFVLRDYLVDTCRGLSKMGFRHFVCLSGTASPRQLTAIEEAGKTLYRRSFLKNGLRAARLLSVHSSLNKKDQWKSPLWPDPLEHGGAADTSLALFLSQSTVDPIYLNLPPVERDPSFFQRYMLRFKKKVAHYWGSPSLATPEKGQETLNQEIRLFFPNLRRVLEGGRPKSDFRSWYSILPPNWSSFILWAMFLVMLFLTLGLALFIAQSFMGFDL